MNTPPLYPWQDEDREELPRGIDWLSLLLITLVVGAVVLAYFLIP